MSGGTLGVTGRRGRGVEASGIRDAAKHPTVYTRDPTTKHHPVQTSSSAKAVLTALNLKENQ